VRRRAAEEAAEAADAIVEERAVAESTLERPLG
jgi:hypothetical protein